MPDPRPQINHPDDQCRIEFVRGPRRGESLDLPRAELASLPAHEWQEVCCWRPGIEAPR